MRRWLLVLAAVLVVAAPTAAYARWAVIGPPVIELSHGETARTAPGEGAVTAVQLFNTGRRAVTITGIVDVADDGLRLTYLGHCMQLYCLGSAPWDADTRARLAREFKYSKAPLVLEAGGVTTLTIVYEVEPSVAEQLSWACITAAPLRLALDDAPDVDLTGDDGWWLRIEAEHPERGYLDCEGETFHPTTTLPPGVTHPPDANAPRVPIYVGDATTTTSKTRFTRAR